MKNKIEPTTGKDDGLSSVKGKIFGSRFSYKRIRFNPKPLKKTEQFKDKTNSITHDINQSYLEIVNEIDDSLKNHEEKLKITDGIDTVSQESLQVSLIKPMETEEVLKEELKPPTEKIIKTKQKVSKPKKGLQKEENKDSCPIITDIQTVNESNNDKKLVDEKTGFGWKGLGFRRIIFDDKIKEYRYEIFEPQLEEKEVAIKNKLIYLFRTQDDLDDFKMDAKEKVKYLEEAFQKILNENHIKLDDESKDRVFYYIFRDFLGYGKIDILMHDEAIEDISCDGYGIPIFIFHNKLESITSNISFTKADMLDSFVVRLSQMCGKQISVYEPIVDGKLSDGSRLQTTLGKTVTNHSTFTIRKFREDPLTPIDLIANNTMSLHMAAYFWMAIEQKSSILFCGGTATGKTTMLNALSLFLPSSYKIVSIEDTREINLPHENWIAGTTRTGFSSSEAAKTGKDVDMFDLVRVALRQRPQAIIVGEVRGKEAYVLFQAMTTGHLSYSTVHASNLHALIQRLENPPISLPRVLLTALDLVVFLNSVTIGGAPARRVSNVTEIIKLDPETNRLVTMTPFRWVSEIDDRYETNGGSNILSRIKMQNGWSDDEIQQELNNRMVILEWMERKNLRSYKDVGQVVSEYRKNPESILRKVRGDNV